MRVNVTLACTECGDRNYITKKNNIVRGLSFIYVVRVK